MDFCRGGQLLLLGNSLVFRLCRRTDTPFKDEGKGHCRMRFIRTMKRNTGNREKMWAGQTAPFFVFFLVWGPLYFRVVRGLPCRSWLAGDGGLWADQSLAGGVHIHSCGNGGLWFRPYGESLGEAPSNQALLPLSFGASLWLGMPSLRSCSVGPPPSAIHGRGRLTRHPCRVVHCAEPPLGLSRGRAPPKQPRRPASRPGCWGYALPL